MLIEKNVQKNELLKVSKSWHSGTIKRILKNLKDQGRDRELSHKSKALLLEIDDNDDDSNDDDNDDDNCHDDDDGDDLILTC